ncbi:hypothetical protein K1719_010078 [Acacia pycnantha]|nr:hypothetical protein K1719_010078 [Acacia pycnantha]
MYPFERFLRTLKNKIKNPRYVEGSIAEAYLVEEAAKFASYYYPPEMMSRWRGSTLDGRDKRVAEWYILNNCEEAAQYLNYFSNSVRSGNPSMAESEVDQFTMSEFPKWLRSYFVENPSIPMKLRGVCPMELQLVLPDKARLMVLRHRTWEVKSGAVRGICSKDKLP